MGRWEKAFTRTALTDNGGRGSWRREIMGVGVCEGGGNLWEDRRPVRGRR